MTSPVLKSFFGLSGFGYAIGAGVDYCHLGMNGGEITASAE